MKPQPRFKLTAIIVLLVFLAGSIAVSYVQMQEVEAKQVVKKTEPLKTVKTVGKNSPKYIKMNTSHIICGGAKCGCGSNYNKYKHNHKVSIKNWCPYCSKKGWKAWGNLRYNPKRTAEGELTCKRCDSDFCLGYNKKTGKGLYEKSGKKKYRLKVW